MLKLKSVFSDNALYQADSELSVKGMTEPGSEVVLKLFKDGKMLLCSSSVSDTQGLFSVSFRTPGPSFDEYSIEISSYGCVSEIKNVLFGELWISSGQSNMEMQNHYMTDNAAMYDALSKRHVRIFLQDWMGIYTLNPQQHQEKREGCRAELTNWMNEFAVDPEMPYTPVFDTYGEWLRCGAEDIPKTERASALMSSAVVEIHDRLNDCPRKNVPIGFLNVSVGGTSGEAWVPHEELDASPELVKYLAVNGKFYDEEHWNKPSNSGASFNQPSALYNLKIAPVEGLKAAGVMWYQGENNICDKEAYSLYKETMCAYFRSYRRIFAADDSFIMIASQINPFIYQEGTAGVYGISKALADVSTVFPGKFLTVTNYDLKTNWEQGRNHPLHPAHKYALGLRFAAAALRGRYGFEGISSAAVASSCEFADGSAFVTVDTKGYVLSLRHPYGFRIAGRNKTYYDAFVEKISDNVLRLSHPAVTDPCSCAYATGELDWIDSLYCGDLPVSPFAFGDCEPFVQSRAWLFAELDSYNVVSYYEGGLDSYKRPTWRPEGNTEICRDDSFTSSGCSVRLRGEESCGAFITAYPCARLDFCNYSSLTFEVSYPGPLKYSAVLLCADKNGTEYELVRDVTFVRNVSFNRDVMKLDFGLPADADTDTVRRLTLHFENVSSLPKVCTVTMENFMMW